MTRSKNHITIFDVFKASHLWQTTDIRPVLEFDERQGKVVFQFPQNPEVQQALDDHLSGSPSSNCKDYINRYKILRAEMYLLRGDAK